MKIINAVWEKRNIGLETIEIVVSESDSWNELKEVIVKEPYQYLVIKVPPSRTDLMFKASSLGLVFVELLTRAHFSGHPPALSSLEKRVINSLAWGEMTASNKERLFEEISLGLFKTDRVAVDPSLGIKQSSMRFLGWLNDELISGSDLYEITKGKELIGFFLIRKSGYESSEAILAGLCEKYQKSGLGFILNHLEIEASNRMGLTSVYSTFSSNNRGALAIHMSMGYRVDSQYYVYVKHKSPKVV